MGFPGGALVENLSANVGDSGDAGLFPGLGRSPGGVMATHSNILAWRISWTGEADWLHTVHEVTKSQTQLSMLTCTHTLRDTQRDMMLLRTPNLWHLVTYKCDYVRKRPAPWCTSISELSVK